MIPQEKDIFDHLTEIGCCRICCVRYFCKKSIDLCEANEYLLKNKIIESIEDEANSKKSKTNPCIVCLGLLQNDSLSEILQNDKLKIALLYDSKVFTCSISMPACILLREHGMRLYLEEKFPEFYNTENIEIPLNRAWKMFLKNPLAGYLGKKFENSDICDFSINISLDHKDDKTELEILKVMQPQIFQQRRTQHRKYNGELFARKCVTNVLELTTNTVFKKHYTLPPQVPTNFVFVKSIECKHNPTYFAGRYLKFSRELSQSPWIIDGVKMMASSVQEIIFENILKVFGIPSSDLKFSSSGREDCDVRCLGKGRPFYVEMLDPKKHFDRADFKTLEKAINESEDVKVQFLQSVGKSELSNIKEGEESKTKEYNALCKTRNQVTQEQIDKINKMGSKPFDLSQSTPIRVLHRRPLAVRTRTIHKMTAESDSDNSYLINLFLTTQAGTYVKEFVHGDFDRTLPNLASIIEDDVDIIALDVVSINLDWPPEINDET